MKKVLHIQKVAGIAGSENHLLTLIPRLRGKDGYESTMLVLAGPEDQPGDFIEQMRSNGVTTDVMFLKGDIDPLLVIKMVRYIRRRRFDLVHTHLFHADLYGTLAARLASTRHIVSTKHGFNPWRQRKEYALLDRIAAYFQQRIIVISEAVGRWLVQTEGLPGEKMRVIHYPMDANQFCCSADSSYTRLENVSKPIIGTVSRLISQKGVHILIEAFALCLERHPQSSLVIVGDGPSRSELEKKVNALGIGERVLFLGYVGHPMLSSAIGYFDMFVLPTFGEGFGLVLLEAMALGKPIVASRVMSIPEIVLHEETGLLVPPKDPVQLSRAILKLIGDPRLCHKLGRAGYYRVGREFTVERMVQSTKKVYEDILRHPDTVA
jgi:glycosyltransferase involved in cell wall biosynthesis